MKLCILENDVLDDELAARYGSLGAMFKRFFEKAGARWDITAFNTVQGQYPTSFDDYDAVLLTGSRADAFSNEAWVVELRRQVSALIEQKKKMAGVCFGHQLIAVCLGAPVARASAGWGVGRMTYDWHRPDLPHSNERSSISLLASHQDQVLELPPGAKLVASNDFCPVASYTVEDRIFCIQPHPEFEEALSATLMERRRALLGEDRYASSHASLEHGHEGDEIGRVMVAFLEQAAA